MLSRREPERVIQLSRVDLEHDSWYEYRNSQQMGVAEDGYLRRYAGALWRHRRLAVAVVVLAILGAVGYLLVATRLYEADVRVLIEPDSPNVVTFKEVF